MLELVGTLQNFEAKKSELVIELGPMYDCAVTVTAHNPKAAEELREFIRHLTVAPGDSVKMMLHFSRQEVLPGVPVPAPGVKS